MNKEEKLEELKQLLFQDRLTDYGKKQLVEIIEKLQKEIEELKWQSNNKCKFDNDIFVETIKRDYISKDKIKEKIKELEKEKEEKEEYGLDCTLIYEHEIDTNGIIRVLQELLEGE